LARCPSIVTSKRFTEELRVTISSDGPLNFVFMGDLHASIQILKPILKKTGDAKS
jgi:hypothetical protein